MIKSRRVRWAVHVAFIREIEIMYKNFIRKYEEIKLFGRPGHIWEDNINRKQQIVYSKPSFDKFGSIYMFLPVLISC
jgi:hypothetical protein